ncbi:MAG TPA: ankyrin repeat domain-containing protein [Thermoanaerobaculia bacterium]|nr:ankyrin repeat domain-containing protein [Thermoanaerobaculia bacterium]
MTRALLEWLLCASAPVLVVWVVTALMRRGPSSARHLLWATALLAMTAIAILRPAVPKIGIPILAAVDGGAGGGVGDSTDPEALADSRVPTPIAGESAGERGGRDAREDENATVGREAGAAGGFRELVARAWRSPTFWIGISLGGTTLLLVHLLVCLVRLRSMIRRAEPLSPDSPWRRDLERLEPRHGRIALLTTTEVRGPLAVGRPLSIILPEEAHQWPASTRRIVLLHELAHLRRRDWLLQLASRVAVAVQWMNPLSWLAARRMVAEAELACDDAVLLAGATDADYAQSLLELTRAAREGSPLLAVAMARRGQLSGRIESILDTDTRRALMTRPQILLAASLLLAMVTALASLQPVPALAAAPNHEVQATETQGRRAASGSDRRAADEALIAAASNGDVAALRRALNDGAEPDRSLPRFGTALIVASANGEIEAVRALLAAGADPALQVHDRLLEGLQRTALTSAARHGHLLIVELLLEAGAEPDAIAPSDATALIEASRHGHEDVVDLLLAWGADAQRQVEGDGDALTGAIAGDHPEVADRLLAAGAEPDQWTDGDESPFFRAVTGGDPELVAHLLDRGADPDQSWDGDGNPLILAARAGRNDVVELLVRRGADPDSAVRGDGSPLIAAAASGNLEATRLLVEAGADVDLVVPGDENPLITAAASGQLETARYLIDAGADVNAQVLVRGDWYPGGSEVRTPLSMARRNGHRDVVELLLRRGARE